MNTYGIERFSGDEILDELVRREGHDWVVRLYNEGARCPAVG